MSEDPKGQRRPEATDLEPILELIWEGKSLRQACATLGLHVPSTSTWLTSDDSAGGRGEQYERAREGRAEALQEEALLVTKAAALGRRIDNQKVDAAGSRAYLDAIKWAAGRMAPKMTPADRHVHFHEVGTLSDDELEARIAEKEARRAVEAASGPRADV